MTLVDPIMSSSEFPGWRPRSTIDLAVQQLRAVERFHRARHLQETAVTATAASRERRMDAARTMDILRRQHEAVVARADEQLRGSGQLLLSTAHRRVILAHHNDWLIRKLALALEDQGVQMAARTDNGADVVGLVVAEQPDLVLVEDTLAMMTGLEVIREVRHFAPETVVVAQAASSGRVGALLHAGANAVITRSTPPDDVVRSMLQLVGVV